MEQVQPIWEYFVSFPRSTAQLALNVVLAINVVGALIIFFKKGNVRITLFWWIVPIAVYGIAWGLSLLASWLDASTDWATLANIAWVSFGLAALGSLIGSLITNLSLLLGVK